MSDNFSDSDLTKHCERLQPILELIEQGQVAEATKHLSQLAPTLPVPGINHLLACLQLMLGDESAATKSLMTNAAIAAFHSTRAEEALAHAKKRLC